MIVVSVGASRGLSSHDSNVRSRCPDSNKTTAEGNPSKYALKMMITMMTTLAMTVCHNWLTSASKVMIDAVLAC